MNRLLYVTIGIGIFILLTTSLGRSQDIWVGKDGNIRNVDAKAMIIDRGELYLATRDEVYHAKDARDKWRTIFSLPAGSNEIICFGGTGKNLLVGTRRGLFRSQDYGKSWKNVFRTIVPDKDNIIYIEQSEDDPKKILVGTQKGIFLSTNSGNKWQDISASLKNVRVSYILLDKDSIYACTDEGLYFKKAEHAAWERIYVRSPLEKSSEDGEDTPSENLYETEDLDRPINCIFFKEPKLYIGIGKKILFSDDGGRLWHAFSSTGLAGTISYITASDKTDKLYCATTKGIFEFNKDKSRWFELYKGTDKVFSASRIIFDTDEPGSLWAVTERGVYRLEGGKYLEDQYIDIERNLKSLKTILDIEPSFKELQRAAMRFAECGPEKIQNWRREARLKALLPKVAFGIDNNRSSTSEIYTSANRDYIVMGPDDINSGFDVSISWELGDLIWSDDQTSIDVRSRLTTQLRNDILDDLRRAYYERKRLQFELIQSPPKDANMHFEKELRMQELTQAIDDLTGNYLSGHTRNSK